MPCQHSESTVTGKLMGQRKEKICSSCQRISDLVQANLICCFGVGVGSDISEIAQLCELWCDLELDCFPELGPQATRTFYNFNLQWVWQEFCPGLWQAKPASHLLALLYRRHSLPSGSVSMCAGGWASRGWQLFLGNVLKPSPLMGPVFRHSKGINSISIYMATLKSTQGKKPSPVTRVTLKHNGLTSHLFLSQCWHILHKELGFQCL
jgi:hypothetical protein